MADLLLDSWYMNKELVQKWIEILPSYKFHHTWLRTFNDEFNPEGVLCDIIDNTSWERVRSLLFLYPTT